MASIHHTTLTPTKLELLAEWLPVQSWYLGDESATQLSKVGGFRLDDPEGEVGIEFMAVRDVSGGQVVTYHVPFTYRAAPLDGADDALIGITEHGVLGKRWVYDGTQDPVLVQELTALLAGKAVPQAQSISDTPDPSVVTHLEDGALDGLSIRVQRVLLAGDGHDAPGHVTAGWTLPDGSTVRGPYVLVLPA
ncbi:maltokinase N-terminal cap-like domain-containing protein [Streptomyces sp. NBC_01465]|uniref:maltokinase N-terminal cap-like domain-containing protein n=1 Tax=Streptomyces sp. NBC_01465 TaxID=2903878 RepID=UPI002E30C38A|nr:1,4-alpha-glucan branching protein [Streptomyces sp. NBC_01465]